MPTAALRHLSMTKDKRGDVDKREDALDNRWRPSALLQGSAVVHAGAGAAWLASPALWLFVAAAFFARGVPSGDSLQRAGRSWSQVAPVTGMFIVLGVLMAFWPLVVKGWMPKK